MRAAGEPRALEVIRARTEAAPAAAVRVTTRGLRRASGGADAAPVGRGEQPASEPRSVARSGAGATASVGSAAEPITAGRHACAAAEDAALAGAALVALAGRRADPVDAGLDRRALDVGAGIGDAALVDADQVWRTARQGPAGLRGVALEVAPRAPRTCGVAADVRHAGPVEAMSVGLTDDSVAAIGLVAARETQAARAGRVHRAGDRGAEVLARDADRAADLVRWACAVLGAGIVLAEAADADEAPIALGVPDAGLGGDHNVGARAGVHRCTGVEATPLAVGAGSRDPTATEERDREAHAPNSHATSLQHRR